MKRFWSALLALALATPTVGQEPPTPATEPVLPEGVESILLPAGDIRMEVWRAGEDGLPVIWVQDMHNYFSPQGEPNYSQQFVAYATAQREFLATLGRDHRAYAPMRRGYGRTDDDGAYDVATHGRDLIALLDGEGIDRAVFIGRTPAQLEMLWLAENHPGRMAGMILLEGTPQPLPDMSDPDLFALASGFWRTSLDISDDIDTIDAITAGRLGSYVPEFLTDPDVQISVPTLYLEGPPFREGQWMWPAIFRMIKAQAPCPEVTEAFPCSVFGDAERVARLEALLSNHPLNELVAGARDSMEQRFTRFRVDPLTAITSDPSGDAMWEIYYQRIRPFLEELAEAVD